jgi:hypothetical protein
MQAIVDLAIEFAEAMVMSHGGERAGDLLRLGTDGGEAPLSRLDGVIADDRDLGSAS